MNIKDKIDNLPECPGIYIMKDDYKNIIYVGKSVNIKNRVKTYFRDNINRSRKIERMVKFIRDIDYITTDTEFDALLLECEYIHNLRPMYNTLMNNYENYKYLKLDKNSLNLIDVVNERDNEGIYFGPFSMNKRLFSLREFLLEYFKLPTCNSKQKCIRYNIDKCIGTCRVNTKEEYNKVYNILKNTLNGDNYLIKLLEEEMSKESSLLNFERALEIKSNIELLKSLTYKQGIFNELSENVKLVVWIKINDSSYKYYLINNAHVDYCQRIYLDDFNKNMEKSIISKVEEFRYEKTNYNSYDKSYIDYINIIYSYIYKNKEINHIKL